MQGSSSTVHDARRGALGLHSGSGVWLGVCIGMSLLVYVTNCIMVGVRLTGETFALRVDGVLESKA